MRCVIPPRRDPGRVWVMSDATPAGGLDLFALPLGGVLQAAHEAILMVDESQQVVALNPAAQRIFGCSAGQALGRRLEEFIPTRHRGLHEQLVRDWSAALGDDHSVRTHRQVTALRADGREFPAEVWLSGVDVAGPEGTRRFVAALLHDLSGERGLRDELRSLQQRLRAVFELAPVALWIADSDRIVFANRAAGRLLGDAHPLVGESVYSLLQPDSHAALRDQVAGVLAGAHGVGMVQGRLLRPDGQPREVEIALAALPDHGRTTVQMVVADVTQRRAEAREARRTQRQLRQLSVSVMEAREEERRRIARELHDELGQRLTALKMELSSLSDGGTDRGTRLPAMLGMLDETVAALRRIAADLRPLMLDDLGLNAAIEWLGNEASRRLGIRVQVDLDEVPDVDERVAIALYRMVQEALTNVARHARARQASVQLRRRNDGLHLSVRDDGVGFPERALQREGRWGLLGMRERAELLGGRLEIDNPPGGGARVRVHLPPAHDTRTAATADDEPWPTP